MKKFLKSFLARILAILARAVVHKYHPRVVMVSGSVGKTSTKDAIAAVLGAHYLVRKSDKSLNSEFGVPFTILGVENPWNSVLGWLLVLKSAMGLLLLSNHYPNVLVLEVGADHPDDLEKILWFVVPDVVVITYLPEIPVHVEAFTSPEAVREEEFSPAYTLSSTAPLIVNANDTYALEMAVRTSGRLITYGTTPNATVRIKYPAFYEECGQVIGMAAHIVTDKTEGKLIVRHTLGTVQLFPVAAAVATGIAFDITLPDTLLALEHYEPPFGRCHLFSGKNNSFIIDDTYNASPAATEEALDTLKHFPHVNRRVAILGDMLELGRYSVMEHERIGAVAAKAANMLITIGVRARSFATSAYGIETLHFDTSRDAASALIDFPQQGDAILVKGSQNMRMERIVEILLANPTDVAYLVRQNKEWQRP